MIGEMLGHYEITAKIGKGGMGIVYRATDTLIGRDVALKTIQLKEIEDPNERQFLKERLFREAKSAGILSHPNIVTVFQIGDQDGLTYIAMEFVDGANLAEVLARPDRPTIETLVSIFDQSAAALDYAHSRGVVHRDIKPGNIIVRADGVAKIADFGVAKISSQNVTRTGMTLGTPHYMSPEQFHGRAIDGRSDQYSLGVMVYEILTGKKPFTADSITGLMYKILHEEPNPRKDNPDLSEDVDAVLRKALAKEPDQRFPSCSAFIGELRGVSGVAPLALPFESHTRASGTPSGHRTPSQTPTPQEHSASLGNVAPPPAPPKGTGQSGLTPSGGVTLPPPPPLPPSQAMSTSSGSSTSAGHGYGSGTGQTDTKGNDFWSPRSPEAGASLDDNDADTPSKAPSGGWPPSQDVPTPASGVPTSSSHSGGMHLPPPPAPAPLPPAGKGTAADLTPKPGSLPPVTAAKKPKPPAGAKPSSKMPLLAIGVVVVIFLLISVIAGILYFRGSATPEEPAVKTETVPESPSEAQPTDASLNPSEGTEGTTPANGENGTEQPGETTAESGANTQPDTPAVQYKPPVIATFIAEPSVITEGGSVKLRWSTQETTFVTIDPGLARGRSIGEVTVSPTKTTRYRLTARGYGGRVTRDVQVTVRPRSEDAGPQDTPPNPSGMSLDALTRALAAGESVVGMDQLMVRVGLNGVSFAVNAQAQSAILAAGERGNRPKDAVVRLVDLAKRGGRR